MGKLNPSSTIFILCIIFLSSFYLTLADGVLQSDDEVRSMYESWLAEHGKSYNTIGEKERRFEIFKNNLRYINEQNRAMNRRYKLGLNRFADLTNKDYKQRLHLSAKTDAPVQRRILKGRSNRYTPKIGEKIPYVDWKGFISPVKDQKQCGSSWAFAALGAIEGLYWMMGLKITFSEQELVDCAISSNGCITGNPDIAYEYFLNNYVSAEKEYPYTGTKGICNKTTSTARRTITYEHFAVVSEIALRKAVASQPIVVQIHASESFGNYVGGVYNDIFCMIGRPNHFVLIVGISNTNGQDYWIVKNSWGSRWGENGYIKMQYGINICGILSNPSYPFI